jgi:predicted HTH domain antitoxin
MRLRQIIKSQKSEKKPGDELKTKIVIEYNQNIPDILQVSYETFEKEAKMAMAVKLFEMGRLSSGMAASIAGIDRVSFLRSLHQYNVCAIDLNEIALEQDLLNA